MYLSERPFELLPVLIEYTSLYLLHNKLVFMNTSLSVMCIAIILLIIAIHDVEDKSRPTFATSTLQPIQEDTENVLWSMSSAM